MISRKVSFVINIMDYPLGISFMMRLSLVYMENEQVPGMSFVALLNLEEVYTWLTVR